MNEYIGNLCSKYGIKSGQFEYFILIMLHPGINQLDIANKKNVGKASVTKALKQLSYDGLIVRKIDQSDKRNALCFISDKGKTISKDLFKISTNIESNLFSGFSSEDMSVFYKYLLKLTENSEKLLRIKNRGQQL